MQSKIFVKIFGETYSKEKLESLKQVLKTNYFDSSIDLVIKNDSHDILTNSELDQKYLTKQEFSNYQQLILKNNVDKMNIMLNKINQESKTLFNKNSFSLSLLKFEDSPTIEIRWQKEPSKKEIVKAEDFVVFFLQRNSAFLDTSSRFHIETPRAIILIINMI